MVKKVEKCLDHYCCFVATTNIIQEQEKNICYTGLKSTVPKMYQLLEEKRPCAKFKIYISKTK